MTVNAPPAPKQHPRWALWTGLAGRRRKSGPAHPQQCKPAVREDLAHWTRELSAAKIKVDTIRQGTM